MSSRFVLTAQLPSILLIAAAIAFPLSLFLLRRYKRAVLRSMNRRTSEVSTPPATSPQQARQHLPALRDEAVRGPWIAASIYALAGTSYALVLSVAELIANRIAIRPAMIFVLFCNYAWPIVLSVILVAVSERWKKALLVSTYVVVLLTGSFFGLGLKEIIVLWAFANLGPTILLLCFLTRGIRAVGPLVFTFTLGAVIGSQLLIDLLGYDIDHGIGFTRAVLSVGVNAEMLLVLVALSGAIGFGIFGWLALRDIGRRYEAKRVTDQSITLDSLWIVFAVVHGVFLSLNGPAWALVAIIAFACYKLTLAIGFRVWKSGDRTAPRLLILRVFSLGRRSERMFNAVAQRWRYAGSIQLIAGPDLATSTVEPHEFLAFLGGKLSRHFIESPAAFEQQLGATDLQRDFDHRFRVSDFFCTANAWQMVLSRLLSATDAVLMDLRGFRRANAGCVFELHELMRIATVSNVVFITDRTTDEAFLNETLGETAAHFRFVKTCGRSGDPCRIIDAICGAPHPTGAAALSGGK